MVRDTQDRTSLTYETCSTKDNIKTMSLGY
jgi:hypothetical protein